MFSTMISSMFVLVILHYFKRCFSVIFICLPYFLLLKLTSAIVRIISLTRCFMHKSNIQYVRTIYTIKWFNPKKEICLVKIFVLTLCRKTLACSSASDYISYGRPLNCTQLRQMHIQQGYENSIILEVLVLHTTYQFIYLSLIPKLPLGQQLVVAQKSSLC